MTQSLPSSTPEAQGVPSGAILDFLAGLEQTGLEIHAFMLLRHGAVLAEGAWAPFSLDQPHALFSVSKSFTSTAVGLAVAEGRLSLDDRVLGFFPEFRPAEVSDYLAAMRLHDLLTMTSGHTEDVSWSLYEQLYEQQPQTWAQTFLAQPVQHAPGTYFVYNSAASYMLAAIVERRTGEHLLDYLRPRLFEPLGITGGSWETNAEGTAVGGWGLSLPVDALARLGQLYLQGGRWNGRPLLSPQWASQATSKQVLSGGFGAPVDWQQGYGFQFWRCRQGAYRADGALGQFIVVMPEQDAVLALNSAVNDMQLVLNELWTRLLPAMGSGALADDAEAVAKLRSRCQKLRVPVVAGELRSPLSGPPGGQAYHFGPGSALGLQQLEVSFSDGRADLTLTTAGGAFSVSAGLGSWTLNQTRFDHVTTLPGDTPRRVAGSAAWTAPDTLEVHLNYLETAGTHALRLTFGGDVDGELVQLESWAQTAFRSLPRETLVGIGA